MLGKKKILDFEKETQDKYATQGLFIFLDKIRFDISNEITILGCTLFSNIIPSQSEMVSFGLSDFYHIEDWSVEQHCQAHNADLKWLNTQVKLIAEFEPHRTIVILTHHSPTVSSTAVSPTNIGSPVSSGFSSDLSKEICWTSLNVRAWEFGHTHFNCDYFDLG